RNRHAPESSQPNSRKQHSENGPLSPKRMGQKIPQTAELHRFAFGSFRFGSRPAFWFLYAGAHPKDQQRWYDPDEVGVTPLCADRDPGERGQPGTDDTGGVKNAGGVGTGARWEDLRHQRGGHGPFAADSHRHKKAQRGDLPERRGEKGEAGENR